MKKYYCDLCGKEIGTESPGNIDFYKAEEEKIEESVDVCDDCYKIEKERMINIVLKNKNK